MNEESSMPPEGSQSSEPGKTARPTVESSWDEVGRQFQALGQSIAQAMRTAWEDENTQRQLQEMRTGLESMVKDVGKAIEESTSSPQGQKIRAEAGRTAEALRSAGEQTVQEVRPQLINALEQVNQALLKLVDRMEKRQQAPGGEAPGGEAPADSDPQI